MFPHMPGEHTVDVSHVVAVDPSGNYVNGYGHTGIACMTLYDGVPKWDSVKVISINAKNYISRFAYWNAIISTIEAETEVGDTVVVEKYVVRNTGFTLGKSPETAMLLGALLYKLEETDPSLRFVEQTPAQAKRRFTDATLEATFPTLTKNEDGRWFLNGKPCNEHCRDALRHLAYAARYNLRKEDSK